MIAHKVAFDFWDFVTHGSHGNVNPAQGEDFDFEVQLVDADNGNILDVVPPLFFHWEWREGPLTPFFSETKPPTEEKEMGNHAG
jgi:hypothetical protein